MVLIGSRPFVPQRFGLLPLSPRGLMEGTIWQAYLVTFGWAMTAAVSMAIAVIILLKALDFSTPKVDEWALIKEGNLSIAIIYGAAILGLAYVIGQAMN